MKISFEFSWRFFGVFTNIVSFVQVHCSTSIADYSDWRRHFVCTICRKKGGAAAYSKRRKLGSNTFFTQALTHLSLPLIHFMPPPRLLIDFKNSKWLTYFWILLCICYCFSHLIGLLFCHVIISPINSLGSLFIFCFSLKYLSNIINIPLLFIHIYIYIYRMPNKMSISILSCIHSFWVEQWPG